MLMPTIKVRQCHTRIHFKKRRILYCVNHSQSTIFPMLMYDLKLVVSFPKDNIDLFQHLIHFLPLRGLFFPLHFSPLPSTPRLNGQYWIFGFSSPSSPSRFYPFLQSLPSPSLVPISQGGKIAVKFWGFWNKLFHFILFTTSLLRSL